MSKLHFLPSAESPLWVKCLSAVLAQPMASCLLIPGSASSDIKLRHDKACWKVLRVNVGAGTTWELFELLLLLCVLPLVAHTRTGLQVSINLLKRLFAAYRSRSLTTSSERRTRPRQKLVLLRPRLLWTKCYLLWHE